MNLSRPDSWQFGMDCLKQTRIVGSIDCLLWRAVVHVDYAVTVPEYSQNWYNKTIAIVQDFCYAPYTIFITSNFDY